MGASDVTERKHKREAAILLFCGSVSSNKPEEPGPSAGRSFHIEPFRSGLLRVTNPNITQRGTEAESVIKIFHSLGNVKEFGACWDS